MRWTTVVITGAILFVAGLLVGFIPEHQKASNLTRELETAQLKSHLSDIRELASLSYLDASKMNYGSASEDAQQMFALVGQVAAHTKDESLRNSLNSLLTFRDAVTSKLSTADASVLEPLQQIVQKTRSELQR